MNNSFIDLLVHGVKSFPSAATFLNACSKGTEILILIAVAGGVQKIELDKLKQLQSCQSYLVGLSARTIREQLKQSIATYPTTFAGGLIEFFGASPNEDHMTTLGPEQMINDKIIRSVIGLEIEKIQAPIELQAIDPSWIPEAFLTTDNRKLEIPPSTSEFLASNLFPLWMMQISHMSIIEYYR